MNWPLRGIAGDVQRWWREFEIIDHPFILTVGVSLLLLLVVVGGVSSASDYDEKHPPRATEGLAYCQQECNTATLKLDSMELRNVGTGRGYVCYCSVRPESMSVTQGPSFDGGTL